jgi:hypothetical protein
MNESPTQSTPAFVSSEGRAAKPVGVAKTHPASREMFPDDPLEMQAFEVPGDVDLMLRLLVEEYARIGWGTDAILELARNPNYQAFHGLYRQFGEEVLRRRVGEIASRCGVLRVKVKEKPPATEGLVQIELPKKRMPAETK